MSIRQEFNSLEILRQAICLEDELFEKAMGPKKAKKYKKLGQKYPDRQFNSYEKLFRWAQRKIEKKSFRSRKTMLYYEKERKKMQRAMGQAPYLDTPN